MERPPHQSPYCPPPYQLVLEIYVSSLERSVRFYTSLGFRLEWQVPDVFAQVSWESCLLFLKVKVNRPPSTSTGNIRIMVPDVDVKYRECREKLGYEIVQEIGDRRFVIRDFIIRDPDGFEVRFGSFLANRGRKEQEGPNDEIVVKGHVVS